MQKILFIALIFVLIFLTGCINQSLSPDLLDSITNKISKQDKPAVDSDKPVSGKDFSSKEDNLSSETNPKTDTSEENFTPTEEDCHFSHS